MSRLLFSFCFIATIFSAAQAGAQNGQRMMQRKGETNKSKGSNGCPRAYIGFSTGINNPVGILGPQVDVAVSPSFSIGSGLGLSSWGYKTFLEARYYFKPCNRGWAVAGGVTYNTGGGNIELQEQETVAGKGTVVVNLRDQTNFMVSGYHFFNLGRGARNRFHLQFGYSVPLTERHFAQTGGVPLTTKGGDDILAVAPGGLILGAGFSFGAGSQ